MKRLALVALAIAVLAIGGAGVASAHPLGNFTINHYARIEVGGERIQIRYVVDMAEISALQELQKVDADGDGTPSRAEVDAYLERAAARYAEGLQLFVDGARVPVYFVTQGNGIVSHWVLLTIATVGVLAGTFAGVHLLWRMSEPVFRRSVSALITALGVYMLLKGMGLAK